MVLTVVPWLMLMISISAAPVVMDLIVYCLSHSFALSNNITFNTKKTMCMKYGEPVKDSEKIILDRVQLKYYETVRHLGNFFNTDNNCTSDINYKCSSFIGYFNKMMSLYSHLQPDVLCRLFKSYCCFFYGQFSMAIYF